MRANDRSYMKPTTNLMHYDGKRLHPWLITSTEIKRDSSGKEYEFKVERRRRDGFLIVMKTNSRGERTLIEQSGYPVPSVLAGQLDAKIKYLKKS